jgi:hypothetical protein
MTPVHRFMKGVPWEQLTLAATCAAQASREDAASALCHPNLGF